MQKYSGRVLLSLIALVWGGQLKGAQAADGREEVHIRKGVELRRKGQDREALANFQKAYEVAHTARAAAQLGLCEQALSQWLSAQIHLADALATESDVWVSKNRSVLEKAKADVETQLGRVVVAGEPSGALVVVGGDVLGRLPETQSTFVLPGSVAISVTADGYDRFEENRMVMAGQAVQVNVLLKPSAAKAVLSSKPSAPSDDNAAPAAVGASAGLAEAPASGREEGSKVLAWSVLGGGAALVGAGVIFGVRSSSLASDARNAEFYDAAKEDSAKSSRTISVALLGVGAIGVAVGAFLFFRTGENTQVALAPASHGEGASVSMKGTW
ncbi:MAG: PEGA domain-containing protein [Deltaproteobacteria bacterium]|nr:PEGA domain-containing protein [Deltaproteobacteria bacterium]